MRSPPNYVNHCEYDDPHGVNEVPVEREHLYTFRVTLLNMTGEGEDEDKQEHQQPNHYVSSVQSNERIKGGSEKIGPDGQPIVIDELQPFTSRADKEDDAKTDGG